MVATRLSQLRQFRGKVLADAKEMLLKAAILVGAAENAGIPHNRIMVDPCLIHVTGDAGQRHLVEVRKFLQLLPDEFEPAVRSTCWLSNASTGAPARLRTAIEITLLPLLAGLGLSSVFVDVLKPEIARTLRLIKVFDNELVYAESAIA